MDILFFGKGSHWATERCLDFIDNMQCNVESHLGNRGDGFPEDAGRRDFDLLISFSSPWIIPKHLLGKSTLASLNFHPGPPEYPGIGCTNFAIHNEEKEYGVTCHHMAEKVDSGPILNVKRFALYENDTVKTLTNRCYHHLYCLFVDVVGAAISGAQFPSCEEDWTRQPYTRKQLNSLCRIDLNMSQKEAERRVRATSFPGYPGAYIEFQGIRFEAVDPK